MIDAGFFAFGECIVSAFCRDKNRYGEAMKHTREGWAESSKALAVHGDDALVMGEFGNADDAREGVVVGKTLRVGYARGRAHPAGPSPSFPTAKKKRGSGPRK